MAKVVVIGATGHVGTYLVPILVETGTMSSPSAAARLSHICRIKFGLPWTSGRWTARRWKRRGVRLCYPRFED